MALLANEAFVGELEALLGMSVKAALGRTMVVHQRIFTSREDIPAGGRYVFSGIGVDSWGGLTIFVRPAESPWLVELHWSWATAIVE